MFCCENVLFVVLKIMILLVCVVIVFLKFFRFGVSIEYMVFG